VLGVYNLIVFASYHLKRRLATFSYTPAYLRDENSVPYHKSVQVVANLTFKDASHSRDEDPYQTLIELCLRDCVKQKKKPKFDWAA